MKYKHLLICIFIILFSSCKSRSKVDDYDYSSSEYENGFYYEDLNSENKKFDDGTYSATVDYYNPETGIVRHILLMLKLKTMPLFKSISRMEVGLTMTT